MQAGERIDLEKMRAAVTIAAAVHPSQVATPQLVPRSQRDIRGFGGRPVVDDPVSRVHLLLVRVRISVSLGIAGQGDLEDANHARARAGSDDADGEFAAGKERLDERGLPIRVEDVATRGRQRRRIHRRAMRR